MILALVIELVLGMAIALLLDSGVYLRGLWQTLLILPMVTPPAVVGLSFRLLEHSDFGVISWILYGLRILNPAEPLLVGTGKFAMAGVLIPDIWQWTPFVMMLLLAGLSNIPDELYEAGRVDGATAFRSFVYITLPLPKYLQIHGYTWSESSPAACFRRSAGTSAPGSRGTRSTGSEQYLRPYPLLRV